MCIDQSLFTPIDDAEVKCDLPSVLYRDLTLPRRVSPALFSSSNRPPAQSAIALPSLVTFPLFHTDDEAFTSGILLHTCALSTDPRPPY